MHIRNLRYTVLGVFIFVSLFSFFAVTLGDSSHEDDTKTSTVPTQPVTILFTGDIMLGRVVESLMERNGAVYPFLGTRSILEEADVTIGNFEGTVPQVHKKTKPYTFTFSIQDTYLGTLSEVGFDILSLANNHAYDFGESGYIHTLEMCAEHNVVCIGNPQGVTENSYYIHTIHGRKIGYLFLNDVFREQDFSTIAETVEHLERKTEYVIAYVHWGNEYELVHSEEQEVLAHALVDVGADLVVGHHPHVVQDVEIYNEALIVYSLGNFIFDQYFSEDVTEGMLLKVTLGSHTEQYAFMGITSSSTKSQPHPMDPLDEEDLFKRVLVNIEHEEGVFSRYVFK